MSTLTKEGGEPMVFRLIWGSLYLILAVLLIALFVFLVGYWKSLPVGIVVLVLFPIICGGVAIGVCFRCAIGKDAFLLDHPIRYQISAECVQLVGLFSKAHLTSDKVGNVRQIMGWIVVQANFAGKMRRLWFAPWFRDRDELVRSLCGG